MGRCSTILGPVIYLVLLVSLSYSASSPPHVILILADDLGWNDISLHGSPQIPTPNIDCLAKQGVTLNNYYTMHLCSPTRGALLTGRHSMQVGLQSFVITETTPFGLGLNETIMPQYLKPLGYSTHLVGKWHQGFFAKELTPLYRGFDSFYGFLTSHESYYDHRCYCFARSSGGKDGYDFRDGYDLNIVDNGTYSTYLYTQRAEKIIREHNQSEVHLHRVIGGQGVAGFDPAKYSGKPLFLYFAQQAVHSGFGSNDPSSKRQELEAPQEIIDKFSYIPHEGRRRFAAMTYLLDESVGNVTRTLQEQGMLQNSIIIFATDNGGPPAGMSFNHASNWPLRGAKATYWQGGVRGDSFIWSPLLKKRGRIFGGLVHVTDWLPTILHAATGSPPKVKDLYGQSMWTSLSEGTPSPRDTVHVNWDKGTGAIIKGKWKLSVLGYDEMVLSRSDWYKPEGIDVDKVNFTVKCGERNSALQPCNNHTSPCLYDLDTDPCEYNNIAQLYTDMVKTLYAELMDFAGAAQPPRNCPDYKWADPVYHGGAWTPYIKLNDTKHDRMC